MDSKAQERKTVRRPLCYMAAAVLMALPSAALTMRNKSAASLDNISGSSWRSLLFQSRLSSQRDSSPLQMMICDERQEFEINLGKAVDTLKHDYPDLLTEPPGTYHSEENTFFSSFGTHFKTHPHSVSLSFIIQTIRCIIQTWKWLIRPA
jgi:hypothetical protein